ncbi:hypothetical protein [Shewanella sp.]|uniref:hypothetical protein n=1 Tax=Shewanella sp. TaxID=50422 RepID=UPI0040541F41
MLVLRFDESWLNATSPLQLRFVGDQIPEPPIRFGGIGIELGLGIGKGLRLDNQLVLHSLSRYIALDTAHIWGGKSAEHQDYGLVWHTKALEQQVTVWPWLTPQLHKQQFSVNWATPDQHQMHTQLDWLTPLQRMNINVAKWSQSQPKEQLASLLWRQVPGTQICQGIAYSYKGQRGFEYSLPWGPHQPQWVCSTRYIPQAGKITMRFGEPWVNSQSPLALRFTIEPKVCRFDDGGGLIDANPSLPSLDLKIPIEPQIRRYYLMQPTITCVRVFDNLPIVISSCSISQSRGQWAKSVSIEFSSRIDAERAHNELLLITINGYDFYVIAEQPSASKVFGSETHSSTGRSRAAELASPYLLPISYTNTVVRSFGGIISDILQQGAGSAGWTVELKGIADFTVPAGAFSVGNKSPIDAIHEAATQLGCMILADDAARKLTIIPRWPTAPWEMATAVPDLTLHDAVITNYSETVARNPLCNVVWLRGEQQGISAKVKRTGTAGNIPAADISAQLIVDNQAARIAGTNALADTGDKLNIALTLPVMADLPPAAPGMLIGIREGTEVFKGTCDSWSIRASVSERGDINIEQTITVIRSIA